MSYMNLLQPGNLAENYVHQLRETIDAYSPVLTVIGEALQNAIDSVCEAQVRKGEIALKIDFDANEIIVRDNGNGFPPEISYLYLGGGDKKSKRLMGRVGVGIKVTLFSSEVFQIRSRLQQNNENWKLVVHDANKFEASKQLDAMFENDEQYLEESGTELRYRLPYDLIRRFLDEIVMSSIPEGKDIGFSTTLKEYATNLYPSAFAALLVSYLRRYTYVGNVNQRIRILGEFPAEGIDITLTLKSNNPIESLGQTLGGFFGDKTIVNYTIPCKYLLIEDTLEWIPKGQKARGKLEFYSSRIFNRRLGWGGSKLDRTDGFNVLVFQSVEEFEELVTDLAGKLPRDIDLYRNLLFPKLNAIIVTIGRIPMYDMFLPGGSRRIISCNGIVTDHHIRIDRGRRQQAVRCLDIVVDVDATLNYGKAHLKDRVLVGNVNRFINEAYVTTLERATDSWVGKMPKEMPEDPEIYIGRPNLELPGHIIIKQPQCENDVIALFFELAGKGLFPDYRIYGLSQIDMFDGRAAIKRPFDTDSVFKPFDDSKLQSIEFKLHARSILKNFDDGEKDSRDLDLLIAWDEGIYASEDYEVYDIGYSKASESSPSKIYPGVSKYIYDAKFGTEIQILMLNEFISHLKNTDEH